MRAACEHVREATEILPKLSKATAPALLRLTDEIQVIERRADETHRQALVAIFDSGFDVPVILRWRDIVDRLEGATDLCQDVAMLLQAIVLENA
jgi:hypothetical protein